MIKLTERQRVKVIRIDWHDKMKGVRVGDTGVTENGGHHPTIRFDRDDLGLKLMMSNQLEPINEKEAEQKEPSVLVDTGHEDG